MIVTWAMVKLRVEVGPTSNYETVNGGKAMRRWLNEVSLTKQLARVMGLTMETYVRHDV
jgi:hypothetical protein